MARMMNSKKLVASIVVAVPFAASASLSILFARVIHSMHTKRPIASDGLIVILAIIVVAHILAVLLAKLLFSKNAESQLSGLSAATGRILFIAAYAAGLLLFVVLNSGR